jgi:hypothetical protein
MSDLYALIETATNAEQRRSLFASEPPTQEDVATGLEPAPNLAEAKGVQWVLASTLPPPPPPAPPEPQYKTQFTSLEYLDRFTEAEQLTVVSATLANAQVKLWYDKMLAASYIDLADPRTAAGVDALIAAGLLDGARRAAILAPELIA